MTMAFGRARAARGGGGRGARLQCAATGGGTEETTEEVAAPLTPEQEEGIESDEVYMKDPQQQANELPMVEIARQLGFDTDEQIFGFTPFAELWTGRLAMAGFTTGVLEEQLTGDTIIQQAGLDPNAPYEPLVLPALVLLLLGLVGAGIFNTVRRARNGTMTQKEVQRYSKFFGLDENSEEQAAQQASANKRTSRSAASQRTGLTQKDNLMWAAVRGITYVVITFSDTSDPRDSNAVVKFGRVLETVAGRMAMIGFTAALLVQSSNEGLSVAQQVEGYRVWLSANS